LTNSGLVTLALGKSLLVNAQQLRDAPLFSAMPRATAFSIMAQASSQFVLVSRVAPRGPDT